MTARASRHDKPPRRGLWREEAVEVGGDMFGWCAICGNGLPFCFFGCVGFFLVVVCLSKRGKQTSSKKDVGLENYVWLLDQWFVFDVFVLVKAWLHCTGTTLYSARGFAHILYAEFDGEIVVMCGCLGDYIVVGFTCSVAREHLVFMVFYLGFAMD